MKTSSRRLWSRVTVGLAAFCIAATAMADPPAHGWRARHDPYYRGYTGVEWQEDYGVRSGRCDTDRIDERDRACVGQALELVPVGSQVVWRNPGSRVDYTMRPIRDVNAHCRDYQLVTSGANRHAAEILRACRRADSSARVAARR